MKQSASDRFWAKVDTSGGPDACWPWTGHRNKAGYGSFALDGGRHGHHQPTGAHRVAYILTHGPIARGRYVVVRHNCDNPPCVNPAHLTIGTPSDNVRDMRDRNRGPSIAAYRSKLTPDEVRAIRGTREESDAALARRFGVSRALVYKVRRRLVWKQVA